MGIFDSSTSEEEPAAPTVPPPVNIRMISAGVFRGIWMFVLSTIPIWIVIFVIRGCN
jgi:hypothetical protein